MAEVRNTFIGSKMNKDLEQRLVPNSEYRDAYNVMISRSEGEDAGSLENVLGNIKLTDFGIDQCEVEAIGVFFDACQEGHSAASTQMRITTRNIEIPV